MKIRFAALIVGLFVTLAYSQVEMQDFSDPHRGGVSGIVVDEKNHPAAEITVTLVYEGPFAGILPNTKTQSDGSFSIPGLIAGSARLVTSKIGSFYPEAATTFFNGEGALQVDIPAGASIQGVVLRLRPVGRLTVEAVDARSHAAIKQFRVRIERQNDPTRYVSGTSEGNTWLVPTDPIVVQVLADGFKPTRYGGRTVATAKPLKLLARQNLHITVKLYPEH